MSDASEATPQDVFLFQYRLGPNWNPSASLREQLGPHAAYMGELAAARRLIAAGPYADAHGGGMAIVRAENLAAAQAMLAADPAIVSGVFAADVRPWAVRFRGAELPPAG